MNQKNKLSSFFLAAFVLLVATTAKAQEIGVEILTSGNGTSLRGLSVVNDNVLWVSGSNGKVGRSTNAGKNWKWMTVKGFEKKEFRDIEAFGPNTAIIMSIGDPAYILKTTDAGESWTVVYENKTPGMFLDAMDFATTMEGIVVGDPVNGKFFMATTNDGGNSWKELQPNSAPVPDSGEAFFAASGTNIRLFNNGKFFLVSGGKRSRLITATKAVDLPIIQGEETTGANSVAVYDNGKLKGSGNIIVVGGDFKADSSDTKNCFYSTDGGKDWKAPKNPPHGYRSCVEFITKKDVVTCGLTGVDLSEDGGKNWRLVSKESFNVCRFARFGTTVYLAGNNGKVGKLVLVGSLER